MTLAELAETMARPALLGLAGKAIETRCRKELTSYFRALKPEIVALKLGEIVSTAAMKDSGRHTAMVRAQTIVRRHRDLLKSILATNMMAAMLIADKTNIFAEASSIVTPDTADTNTGPSAELGAAWADEHAATAIVGIDDTTVSLIADAVATGIEESLGVPGTARLIAQILDGMMDRATMIARTELNSAFSQAFLIKAEALGITYKRWILGPNPCEICAENADEGAIPLDGEFPSGDTAPPAHPNCACAVTGARPPEE
jgi:hypothetical protein